MHTNITSVLLLVLLLVLPIVSLAEDQCVITDGNMPSQGKCEGPVARAQLAMTALTSEKLNSGCPANQVLYYKDDDTNRPMCGECVPGTSGVEDPLLACKIDEYCSDDAYCVPVRLHPLFGADCPYEQGLSTKLGWCGPGLRCINHKCLPCENGMYDYADGKMCVANQWTYSQWEMIIYEPTPAILGILIAIVALISVVSIFGDCVLALRRFGVIKREGKRQEAATTDKVAVGDDENAPPNQAPTEKLTLHRRRQRRSSISSDDSASDSDPSSSGSSDAAETDTESATETDGSEESANETASDSSNSDHHHRKQKLRRRKAIDTSDEQQPATNRIKASTEKGTDRTSSKRKPRK